MNGDFGDINNNHISIHFGTRLAQLNVVPDLDDGGWYDARIEIDFIGGTVRIELARDGLTLFDSDALAIPDLAPYEGRVHFAARSGGFAANHDVANINVQFDSLVTF
jgi:hypothetical protein